MSAPKTLDAAISVEFASKVPLAARKEAIKSIADALLAMLKDDENVIRIVVEGEGESEERWTSGE
jgi:hypothetical protein